MSSAAVDRLLRAGLLLAVHAGVYRDPAAPRTEDQHALAAVLSAGPGAIASHRLAVAVWGMRNYRCGVAEVTAPRLVRRPGLIVHQSKDVNDAAVVRLVPATSPARTMLDVAAQVSEPTLAQWLQTWASTNVVDLTELERLVMSRRKHRGATAVLRCLEKDRTVADSPVEAALGRLLVRYGLPQPELHHMVTLPSGKVFELDWSYPAWRVAFEVDGYGVHLRSRKAFDSDRIRRNELEIAGWTVLNFTHSHITRRPQLVVNQVRRIVQRAVAFDFHR